MLIDISVHQLGKAEVRSGGSSHWVKIGNASNCDLTLFTETREHAEAVAKAINEGGALTNQEG